MNGPRWQHDCNTCRYVGSVTENSKIHWDLYVCEPWCNDRIARYGDSGPEYLSRPEGLPVSSETRAVWVYLEALLQEEKRKQAQKEED